MAVKKSELYSSIWASCDELRGGMDPSQYKDYVLVLLFIKYVSDKYDGVPFAPITIPKGSSFKDLAALKGKTTLGDDINKKIIAPLANANKLSDMPDFNDPNKLGTGKEMVDRLTNLIAIFEDAALDFSKNRAEGDDLLGDAYEYLMCNFATESGKSKGQFYTPSEVSRVIAQVLGIRDAKTSAKTTVYDPTCGSGSLLLKVADEARSKVALYGQEKDSATSGLARMNMILHDNPTSVIAQGNTLASPKFLEGGELKTFDYVCANPPFSDKRWSTGLHPNEGGTASASGEQATHDYGRFEGFGVPPAKQGDYAFLLHIVRSLKSTGKGACILPHGVLFRGNAEGDIRRNLIRRGFIKGIIGLPPNLFFGTGIPACIVVLDKEHAHTRKGIFMIDAGKGFMKDGPKNRLRARDMHRMVDVFTRLHEVPRYSRMVPVSEIEKNDFNLNLPRYIDSQEPEDLQDIEAHLKGGLPVADVDALQPYWDVCPGLRHKLFAKDRPGYLKLNVAKDEIKTTIFGHPEFTAFLCGMESLFAGWCKHSAAKLKALKPEFHPVDVIKELSENILALCEGRPLIDPYAVYQIVMDYWVETMQDDCYLIDADGWKAETHRIIETKKSKDGKDKQVDKGWTCDLLPKKYVVAHFFAKEQKAIDELMTELESTTAAVAELEEENGGDDGAFAVLDKVNRANVAARLKEIKNDKDSKEEAAVLNEWLKLSDKEADLKRRIKDAEASLDALAYAQYPKLTEADVKTLVVDDKWLTEIMTAIRAGTDRVSQALTQRIKELAERYGSPLPEITDRVAALEAKVNQHLKKMGFEA